MRAAIQRHEALSRELERHGHHRLLAVDLLSFIGIAGEGVDLRILEDRHVELRGLLANHRHGAIFSVTIFIELSPVGWAT
jgi:hypothetical protein